MGIDITDPTTWTNDMLYATMMAAHDSKLFNKVMEEHLERLTTEANKLQGDSND